MENQKIKQKIQKVLALLEGAKTEGEAQAASLKLQELLVKNNLSIEEVRESVASENQVDELEISVGTGSTRWKRSLARVIAENYRCDTFSRLRYSGRTRRESVIFVGEVEDAKLAEKVFVVTIEVAQRLYKKWCKETRELKRCEFEEFEQQLPSWLKSSFSWKPDTATKNGWYAGFIRGLKEAYEEQVQNNLELAMVLVTPTSVRERMEELSTGFKWTRSRSVSVDATAFSAGASSGRAYGSGTALAS